MDNTSSTVARLTSECESLRAEVDRLKASAPPALPEEVLAIIRKRVSVRSCGSGPCETCEENRVLRVWLASSLVAIDKAIEAVAAPPALPEDVRETLLDGLHYASIWYENNRINARLEEELIAIEAARVWLASSLVASDKAVCPKCTCCGCEELRSCEVSSGTLLGDCNACGARVRIESVLARSTPSEPKGTP